jgi:hypothetical protein
MTSETVNQKPKSEAELLEQYRADNLRLTADNLRLRTQRQKLRNAFARFAHQAFIKLCAARAPQFERRSA